MSKQETITLEKTVEESTKRYGELTIEERALPDFRDGLKPVQRRIIYEAYRGKVFTVVKTARLVGNVLGKWHPHGDASVVEAIKTLVHGALPAMHGSGNWGSIDGSDNPAGMRYTECCLSNYGKAMLDKPLMDVVDYVPNYDDKDVEPVILPFKLPNLLLNGTFGVCSGISPTNIPTFERGGVVTLLKMAYKKRNITPALCLKYLKFNMPYGGVCTSGDTEKLQYFKTGNGTLSFTCDYHIDYKESQMIITGLVPYLTIEKIKERAVEKSFVRYVYDESPRGVCEVRLVIQLLKKTKKEVDAYAEDIAKSCLSMSGITRTLCTQVTERNKDSVTFRHTTIPQIIMDWAKWRVSIEKKMCRAEIAKLDAQIHRFDLLLAAIQHREEIMVALNSKTMDIVVRKVMKILSCSKEDANTVLDLQIRVLAKRGRLTAAALSSDLDAYGSKVPDSKLKWKRIIE